MQTLTPDKLSNLIAVGEGISLEFKRTAAHLGREICAFANVAGGWILIGVDDAGSGIKRMRGDMEEHGCSAPSIEIAKTWFSISFPRSGTVFKEEVTGEVTGEVKKLVEVLANPLGRLELQEKLALKSQANFRNLYLVPALEQGLVEMTIPDKPTSRLQKYRLTKKGKLVSMKKRVKE